MTLYRVAPQPAVPMQLAAYPSSMTDAEWAIIQPLVARPASPHGGRPPKHPLRAIVDAIRDLVRSGGAWRLLPGGFPPWQTVYWWFATWTADATFWQAEGHDWAEVAHVVAGIAPSAEADLRHAATQAQPSIRNAANNPPQSTAITR